MSDGSFTLKFSASQRNDFGHFISTVHDGAIEAANEGGQVLQKMVMSAILGDGLIRSGELLGSVEAHSGGTQATVTVGSGHAAPLEEGAAPHLIPNAFGWGITVHHPGNRAYHFFQTATSAFSGIFPGIARSHMP